jgi:hypothetical protein
VLLVWLNLFIPFVKPKVEVLMTFFLPRLRNEEGIDIKEATAGQWNQLAASAFQDVASSLEVPPTGGDAKSVSSIPDMWARPLAMEMALHNRKYPVRRQMIEQWQGMLAAIALAEVRGFPLRAELLELAPLKETDSFARSLFELLPDPRNSLYQLEGKHPWQDLYLFLWNGKSVGMTTPGTLVCPAEEGEWTGLPWWSGGRLRSPIAPVDHLNPAEKQQLWHWLEGVRQQIGRSLGLPGVNVIAGLLREFQAGLGNPPTQVKALSDKSLFFGVELNRGALSALNRPIKAIPRPSSVRLVASTSKTPNRELLIIPERQRIAQAWNQPEQNIWIHETTSLAAFKPEEMGRWNVNYLLEQDIFLPELFFITQTDALPGGMLPKGMESLAQIYEGRSITPLLPINPVLLDYLAAEDLIALLEVQQVSGNTGPMLRFVLDLPLAGMNDGNPPLTYRIAKDYTLKKENAIAEVPVLEIWPNFRMAGWQEYYAFFYDPNLETFQVNFAKAKEANIFKGVGSFHVGTSSFSDTDSNCQLTQLTEFPTFIDCRSKNKAPQGLILLKQPPEVGTTKTTAWKVGVDFGTSFTNVYVERNGAIEQLRLEPLHCQITGSKLEDRQLALYEYFIASTMEMHLSTVLTTRGCKGETFPILDGRIFIPRDDSTFKPKDDDWIRTNLKWSSDNLNYNRLFLKHLILQISAQAAANNIREIQWAISYPSAFSRSDIRTYARNWQVLTESLQDSTGMVYRCPEQDDLSHFRTEGLAVAQYFADFELPGVKSTLDLVNTTCIDIGGGTSDISIWEQNKLVHQCSVQLAGKELFSQFIQMNPGFLERKFNVRQIDEWKKLQGFQFYVKLDVLMRRSSEGWLRNARDRFEDDPEFQGLAQLITIGVAGLYYYAGLLLKVLHQEGKYTIPEITPVYVGGNGSRLFNWLAEGGQFDRHCEANDLFSAMLSLSSGFENIGVKTALSPRPKDEVACGLVLNSSKLEGLNRKDADPVIAGECCQINEQDLEWDARIQLKDQLDNFTVGPLVQLPKFLNSLHIALDELDIEGIRPLEGYQVSDDLSQNEQLWRETNRQLKSSLLRMRGNADDVRLESPFILSLKALLQVLGDRWAEKWRRKA